MQKNEAVTSLNKDDTGEMIMKKETSKMILGTKWELCSESVQGALDLHGPTFRYNTAKTLKEEGKIYDVAEFHGQWLLERIDLPNKITGGIKVTEYNEEWNKDFSDFHATRERYTFIRDWEDGLWYVQYRGNSSAMVKHNQFKYWRSLNEEENAETNKEMGLDKSMKHTYFLEVVGESEYAYEMDMVKAHYYHTGFYVGQERKRVTAQKGLHIGASFINPFNEEKTEWIADYIRI